MKRVVLAGAALLAFTISSYSNAALLAGWSPDYAAPGVSAGPISDAGSNALVSESTSCSLGLASCIIIDPKGVTTGAEAVTGDRYFAFSASASGQGLLYLSTLKFVAYKGGEDAENENRGWELRTSVDGYASQVSTGVVDCDPIDSSCTVPDNFSIDLSSTEFQGLTTIDFRLFAYSPTSGKVVNFANIELNGLPTSVPVPLTLVLLTSGLGFIGFSHRRRNPRAAESRG